MEPHFLIWLFSVLDYAPCRFTSIEVGRWLLSSFATLSEHPPCRFEANQSLLLPNRLALSREASVFHGRSSSPRCRWRRVFPGDDVSRRDGSQGLPQRTAVHLLVLVQLACVFTYEWLSGCCIPILCTEAAVAEEIYRGAYDVFLGWYREQIHNDLWSKVLTINTREIAMIKSFDDGSSMCTSRLLLLLQQPERLSLQVVNCQMMRL